MNYRTFTTNLSNLERYRNDLHDVEIELDSIFYALRGVKGVGYTDNHGTTNNSQKALNWLSLDEKYNAKLKERDFIKDAIDQVESILTRMPEELREMLVKVYIEGWTFTRLGAEHGYSNHGMWQYMRRESEKYL